MNYESELQEVLIESLKNQYGIQDDIVLYVYFQLRYRIWKIIQNKNIHLREVSYQIEFVLSELNIPLESGKFRYKEEWILSGFSLENSLQNIMETWNFEQSLKSITNDKGITLSMEKYIEEEWKKIRRKALNKAKPFKNTPSYNHYLQKHALDFLNKVFQATPSSPSIIPHIHYPHFHNPFIRTMEEKLSIYIHSEEYKRTDTKTIEEKDLEEFLRFRLEKIEEGLRYIDHQVSIPDGRVDILARDKNDIYVIIELKVVQDKELIWQCMYYELKMKEKLNVSKIRMITLAPEYPPYMLLPLKQIPHVEIMTYTPYVEMGVIKDIQVSKVS